MLKQEIIICRFENCAENLCSVTNTLACCVCVLVFWCFDCKIHACKLEMFALQSQLEVPN